jgi:hypothetical protein
MFKIQDIINNSFKLVLTNNRCTGCLDEQILPHMLSFVKFALFMTLPLKHCTKVVCLFSVALMPILGRFVLCLITTNLNTVGNLKKNGTKVGHSAPQNFKFQM